MNNRKQDIFENLSYFVEWGGKGWERLVAYAIHEFLGTKLEDQQILDIGTRFGKMACLFAMLGGIVTGIDINRDCLTVAEAEAEKWGVQHSTSFIHYDGNLNIFPNNTFDVVFTKSVLVVIPKLGNFLHNVCAKLRPQGKVVFVENGRGNCVLHALRFIRHRRWDYTKATYFTDKELSLLGSIFEIKIIKKYSLPPIYLICGNKK